jgi:hypothetical protein
VYVKVTFPIVSVLCLTAVAHAGEVHTRNVAGTWSSDPQRGTFNGSVANDGGYSFWLTDDQVSVATPVTVIAQVRFKSRVDYGGAGVALIDPAATTRMQKHVRIELSEREDTAGVGGWLGNENHYSGASKRASKDIKVGEWYELALKVDGIHATGFLDGTEVFSADVPELRQMPQTLAIAPFVVEADVEIRVIVRRGGTTSGSATPATSARIADIAPYGHDDTANTEIRFATGLPRPSSPHAEWSSSYELKGDRLCVRIASLRTPEPPSHTIAVGYRVTLDGAIFDTGSRTKIIIVSRFSGMPTQATAGTCETVVIGGTPREPPPEPPAKVDPVDPYGDAPPLPADGHIRDLLPAKSKKQAEIEKQFLARIARASGPEDYRAMYAELTDWILVVGKYHFLLEPVSRQWHVYSRVHDTWEPTGLFAGDATFSVVRGKLKITKKKRGKA